MLPMFVPGRGRRSVPFLAFGLALALGATAVWVAARRLEPRTVTIVVPVPVAVPRPVAVTAPAPSVLPCRPGSEDVIEPSRPTLGSSHFGRPWVWYEVAQDCRGQIVTLAATDRVRIVLAQGADIRIVELPELAVPGAIGHFRWDAGIDLVVGKGRLVVVGNAPEDLARVRAMISNDGGRTWTRHDLGPSTERPATARMRANGAIEWRSHFQRKWTSATRSR